MVATVNRVIKQFILIIIVTSLFSCSTNKELAAVKKIAQDGYSGLIYEFTDNGNRSIRLEFLSDSILTISNKPSIAQTYYLLSFNKKYSYRKLGIGCIKIAETLYSDRELCEEGHIKPFSTKQFTLDIDKPSDIFPELLGDTIWFSADLEKLQANDFCFEKIR